LRGTLNTDNDCNLYVADYGDNQVKMINPDGSATSFAGGIDRPRYQVFDFAGNLYVGSFDGNIYKFSTSGAKTVVAGGIWSPQGMGFDSAGNLYVAGGYDGKIHRIAPDGSKIAMDSGFTYPKHLSVKTDGSVYVVGNSGTFVLSITPQGGKANLVDLNETILGMATDGEYLYVSHSDKISRIDSFGQVTHIATDLDQPSSLTVCDGNVFVTVRDGIVKM
jgi:sugar lactone lactonase YvrE